VGGGRALAGYLPGYLAERAAENYPYDITYLRWNVNGDNGAPDEALAGVVKQWNEEHVYPQLIIATTATAFREFEQRYGPQLPVFRGDFTPYWEDGAASSALETSLNRDSAERLVQAEVLWTLLCPKRPLWPEFAEAWRNVLLYSEHTWGAYDSVENPDRPFVRDQWRIKHSFAIDADRQSRELLAETVFSPGLTIATRETHVNTITVFNTNSWPRTDLVVLPRELPLPGERVEDASGKPVLSQRLTTGEFAFLASEVPPLAGKSFTIKEGGKPTETHLRADADLLFRHEQSLGHQLLCRATGAGAVPLFDLPSRSLSAGGSGAVRHRVQPTPPRVRGLAANCRSAASDRLAGRRDRDLVPSQPGRPGTDRAPVQRRGQGSGGHDSLGCAGTQGDLAERPQRAPGGRSHQPDGPSGLGCHHAPGRHAGVDAVHCGVLPSLAVKLDFAVAGPAGASTIR
jgi:hypothetical protein